MCVSLHLCRYLGTDVAVMTSWQEGCDPAAAFAAAYQREFGFVLDRPVVVDDVRVRATGRAADLPSIQVGDTFGRQHMRGRRHGSSGLV
jgi:5-oxoprolinase (ATP-hydrolysing)